MLFKKIHVPTFFILMASASSAFASSANPVGTMPRWPMLVGALICFIVAVFMMRWRAMWHTLDVRRKILRVVGIVLGTLAVFVGAFVSTQAPPSYPGAKLNWLSDYALAQKQARKQNKPIMVDFTATWCAACHELEAEVFNAPKVKARLASEFVLLKVDFDKQAEKDMSLLNRFEVSGLPRIAFESSAGTFLKGASFDGKLKADVFHKKLNLAAAGATKAGQSKFEKTLSEQGLWAALLLVFVAGLFASMTPCVYPLIPITISLFGARQAESRWESFTLSVTYVFGISVTYSVLGVTAASVGTLFGGAMQSPFVLVGLSVLFFVLGLSSVGLFDLRLPGNLQTKLSQKGGAGYLGAFVMGLVAGIIAAPCVGPIVAGVLLYVARQQDIFLGWLLLTVFSFGMGVLFIVLGTFSSLLARLPKSGGWMDGIKLVFGVIFFGMALYYVRLMVPALSEGMKWLWSSIVLLLL